MKKNSPSRRIAIVHDTLLYLGGAERVLKALLDVFPDADLYTAFISPELRRWVSELTSGEVYVSPFDQIPFSKRIADWFKLPLFYHWARLDLSRYDIVISSSHSFSSKAVVVRPGTIHVSYIHTPPRYLYKEYNETRYLRNPFIRLFVAPFLSWARTLDYQAAQRPNLLLANSKTVQERIKTYYGRESAVVYPPVVMVGNTNIKPKQNKNYYLCVSRLVKQKSIDLVIEACNKLNVKLHIVGEGPEFRRLKEIGGKNVVFRGHLSDSDLGREYSGSRALIHVPVNEDFGLVPVEAMRFGTPVIGFADGGLRETIVSHKTGILFSEHTVAGLTRALKLFEMSHISAAECRRRAELFTKEKFVKSLLSIINKYEYKN